MNISELQNLLGESFGSVEELILIKYNDNIKKISSLSNDLNKCNGKLNDTLKSFGLDNCVILMKEIDELNDKKSNLNNIQNEINILNIQKKNMNNVLQMVLDDINKSSIGLEWADKQSKKESIISQINKIDEEISLKVEKMAVVSKIDKQIEENYNDISQSMIVLDEEQKDEIHNIYVEAANIKKNISETQVQNNKILIDFPNITNNDSLKNSIDVEENKEDLSPDNNFSEVQQENEKNTVFPDDLEEKIIKVTEDEMNNSSKKQDDNEFNWKNPENAYDTSEMSEGDIDKANKEIAKYYRDAENKVQSIITNDYNEQFKNDRVDEATRNKATEEVLNIYRDPEHKVEKDDLYAHVTYTDGLKAIADAGKKIINSKKIKNIIKLNKDISMKILNKINEAKIKAGDFLFESTVVEEKGGRSQ